MLFALSPSGRAFTLAVSQDSTVMDAKKQIAANEGVHPCHQRLVWRGITLAPDHALLNELGVRSGDTLFVGYRVSGTPPESSVQVVDLKNNTNCGVADITNQEAANSSEAERVAEGSGRLPMRSCTATTTTADDREQNASREDGGVDVVRPADVGARNGGVDFAGCIGNGDSGMPADMGVREHEKTGGRRAWWSKRARGNGDSNSCQPDFSPGEALGAAGTSSSGSTNTRRVSPAQGTPVHEVAMAGATGSARGLASAGDGAGYVSAAARAVRVPLTPSGGRTNFPGWARWKQGRRVPASPVSSDGGGGRR